MTNHGELEISSYSMLHALNHVLNVKDQLKVIAQNVKVTMPCKTVNAKPSTTLLWSNKNSCNKDFQV